MKSTHPKTKDTGKAPESSQKAVKRKPVSLPRSARRLRPKKGRTAEKLDEDGTSHETQSSSEEFDFQKYDNLEESDDEELDGRGPASPHGMPGPSKRPFQKASSSRAARDIDNFFERGDKKTGTKTVCILCRYVSIASQIVSRNDGFVLVKPT
jgi:hypothetical protein